MGLMGGSSSDGADEAVYSNEISQEEGSPASYPKNTEAQEDAIESAETKGVVPGEMEPAAAPEYGFSDGYELAEELGFSMSCPIFQEISEKAGLTEASYAILDGNIGEISFSDGEHTNYLRKAVGTEDISGDYKVYATELEFDGEECSGTLKGKADDYQLAVWTAADGYTYAAYVYEGLTDKEWREVIDSLM